MTNSEQKICTQLHVSLYRKSLGNVSQTLLGRICGQIPDLGYFGQVWHVTIPKGFSREFTWSTISIESAVQFFQTVRKLWNHSGNGSEIQTEAKMWLLRPHKLNIHRYNDLLPVRKPIKYSLWFDGSKNKPLGKFSRFKPKPKRAPFKQEPKEICAPASKRVPNPLPHDIVSEIIRRELPKCWD